MTVALVVRIGSDMRAALLAVLLAALLSACGASVEPGQPEPTMGAGPSPEILGCLVELAPEARAASCSFVAEAGQAYWAEVSGPVLAGTSAEVCTPERCDRVTKLAVEPGLGARVTIPAASGWVAWSVRFVSNP